CIADRRSPGWSGALVFVAQARPESVHPDWPPRAFTELLTQTHALKSRAAVTWTGMPQAAQGCAAAVSAGMDVYPSGAAYPSGALRPIRSDISRPGRSPRSVLGRPWRDGRCLSNAQGARLSRLHRCLNLPAGAWVQTAKVVAPDGCR